MVSGKHKSRSLRRVYVKTPGAKVKLHYRKKKPKATRCGMCKKPLKGIPRDVSKLPKTKKTPQRPFGGLLCSKCKRITIKKGIKK